MQNNATITAGFAAKRVKGARYEVKTLAIGLMIQGLRYTASKLFWR
jgi:hypothetical protein